MVQKPHESTILYFGMPRTNTVQHYRGSEAIEAIHSSQSLQHSEVTPLPQPQQRPVTPISISGRYIPPHLRRSSKPAEPLASSSLFSNPGQTISRRELGSGSWRAPSSPLSTSHSTQNRNRFVDAYGVESLYLPGAFDNQNSSAPMPVPMSNKVNALKDKKEMGAPDKRETAASNQEISTPKDGNTTPRPKVLAPNHDPSPSKIPPSAQKPPNASQKPTSTPRTADQHDTLENKESTDATSPAPTPNLKPPPLKPQEIYSVIFTAPSSPSSDHPLPTATKLISSHLSLPSANRAAKRYWEAWPNDQTHGKDATVRWNGLMKGKENVYGKEETWWARGYLWSEWMWCGIEVVPGKVEV